MVRLTPRRPSLRWTRQLPRLLAASAAIALALLPVAAPGKDSAAPAATPAAAAAAPANAAQGVAAPTPGTAATQGATATVDVTREAVDRRLIAAEAELAAIETAPGQALDAPPGTPEEEIAERMAIQRAIVSVYQQQRDMIDRSAAARASLAETERAEAAWRGLPATPPYSVLAVDAMRDAEINATSRIASAEARRGVYERMRAASASRIKAARTEALLASEAADRGRGTPESPRLEWARRLAGLRARQGDEWDRLMELGLADARIEKAAAEATLEFARRRLAAVGQQIAFLPGDLERVQTEVDERRREAVRTAKEVTHHAALARAAELDAAAKLAAAREAGARAGRDAGAETAAVEQLAWLAELRREEAETARVHATLVGQYQLVLDSEHYAWKVRSDALKWQDPVRARAEFENLSEALVSLQTSRDNANQEIAFLKDRIAEQETRLTLAPPAEQARIRSLLDTYRERLRLLEQVLVRVQPLERLLSHFRADFAGHRDVSFLERARDAGAAVLLVLRRIWNYQIITVEDTLVTSDGRTVPVERSVTVGKSFGAVLIVALGYLLSSVIVRWIERMVVRRRGVPAQSAALVRSWVLFLLTALLAVLALLTASIPLTAFAFLGGALAIAAGFGLQTVLKNFVAGVMLLFERPMRLGDLVEVDGFRGRVTSIGIRASTITSADGIETMIPNSAFIENKLTNWTYSSPEARQTLTIGVAYGTPLRRAGDILLEVLGRHGQILKSPAPQVYADAFADSSINFAVTYWLDMRPGIDPRRVKSDVLQMIDTAFAAGKIAMPFPQHDVHVDAAKPLRVEVVTPRADTNPN